MSKCPKCGQDLCDPDLYNKVNYKDKVNLKTLIECPTCNFQATLKEFYDA